MADPDAAEFPGDAHQLLDLPDRSRFPGAGLVFSNWIGLVAASGVPVAMIGKIHAVVAKTAASPMAKVRDRLVGIGLEETADLAPAQLAQSVRSDFEHNAEIVKTIGIEIGP